MFIENTGGDGSNNILIYQWYGTNPRAGDYWQSGNSADNGWEGADDTGWGEAYFQYTYTSGSAATLGSIDFEDYTSTTANATSSVTSIGTANVTEWGFQWGTTQGVYPNSVNTTGNTGEVFAFELQMTGLSVGTVYYVRSYATSSVGTVYSAEQPYSHRANPVVTTGTAVYGNQGVVGQVYFLHGEIVSTGSSGNVSWWGFQIGSADGVWDFEPPSGELITTSATGSPAGDIIDMFDGFAANTTYYYRAAAGYLNYDYTVLWGYGETESFTTYSLESGSEPVVTTDGAVQSGVITTKVTFQGTVVDTDAGIVEWGFEYSPEADTADWVFPSEGYVGAFSQTITALRIKTVGYTHAGSFTKGTTVLPEIGTTFYYRAYAEDSFGRIGYGEVESYTTNAQERPDFRIDTNGYTVLGTIVTLKGSVTNPGGMGITKVGFSWGTTESANDNYYSLGANEPQGAFEHTEGGFTASTLYYFKAGVLASGNWYWSTAASFTTGTAQATIAFGAPEVTTGVATSIGATFFTANGNLTSLGDADVTERGFSYSLVNSGEIEDWAYTGVSGNYSTGAFTRVISTSQSGTTVYYAASAENQHGRVFGAIYYVKLAGTAGNAGSTGGTGGGGNGAPVAGGIPNAFDTWVNRWGLNQGGGAWLLLIGGAVLIGALLWHNKVAAIICILLWVGFILARRYLNEPAMIILVAIIAAAIIWSWVRKVFGFGKTESVGD